MEVFKLRSEDLTNVGGRMGTGFTTTHWSKLFSTVTKAKKYAEKDYGKSLKWTKIEKGFQTEDLGYVMYHITKEKIY